MEYNPLRGRTGLFLSVILIVGCFYGMMMPEVLTQTLSLSLSPSSQTAEPGGTVQYIVNVNSGYNSSIELLVSPPVAGITVNFSPSKSAGLQAPLTSIMTVYVSASMPTGTYTLNVWAHPLSAPFPGPANKQYTIQLNVVPPIPKSTSPPFDFTLTLSPSDIEVAKGGTAHYKIHIMYSDPSYSGTAINIHVDGLGPTMNWDLTPSGDLSITTSPTTPSGTYTLEVVGSAQGVVHHVTATLIVGGPPPEELPPEEQPPEESPQEPPPEEPPSEEPPYEEQTGVTPSITVIAGIMDEEIITISGSISPPIFVEGATVDVTYTGPNGERVTHNVPVEGYDTFRDTYKPTNTGLWTMTVDWEGNEEYSSASGQPTTVTIKPEGFPILMDPLFLIIIVMAVVIVALITALTRRGRTAASQRPQIATRYCANCGVALKPGNKFCRSCGERIE